MADAKKSSLNPGANAFTPGGVGPQREPPQQYAPANVPAPSFRGGAGPVPRPGFPPSSMHNQHHHHHAAYAASSGYRPANVQVGGASFGMPQYANPHAHLGNGAPQSLGGGGPMGGVAPFHHHHANHTPMPPNAHHHHHLHHHHHPQNHAGYVPHNPGPQFNPPPGPSQHNIAPLHANPHALAAHHHHHHHLAHHAHHHHHHFAPPHAAQSPAVIDRSLMKPTVAQPSIPNAILCVANQTFEDMKSEFCKQLAATKGAKHIVLEDQYNPDTNVVEVSRLEQLERELDDVLAAVSSGTSAPTLIIENAASRSKHEIFYIDDLLRRKKIALHTIVLFVEPTARDNVDENATDYVKHPIGFEICSKYIDEGRLYLIDTPASVEVSMQLFMKDQGDRMSAKTEVLPEALRYPEEELPCSHVVMEANLRTALTVLKDATAALDVKEIFTPLGVSPARVLDYSHFTKRSHFLRSYKATLLYDGERVSVVGHQNHVYILTGATGIVYRFDDETVIPACLRKLLADKPSISAEGSALRFVFSAIICAQSTPKRHTVLLSDVLFLNGVAGNKMYLTERLDALRAVFADESSSPQRSTAALTTFVPQTYFDVEYIGQHINKDDPLVQGICLVHPGYCLSGTYDRLNYIWWLPEPRHLEVRLWGGVLKTTVNNAQMWFFDALVLDADGCTEEKLQNLQVVIPDKTVEEQCINDGNIVDVVFMEDKSNAGPKPKAGKGAVMPSTRLSFVRRKLWTVFPMSKVFVDAILDPSARWSKESLVRSTSFLTSLKMERPVEAETIKPEFAE